MDFTLSMEMRGTYLRMNNKGGIKMEQLTIGTVLNVINALKEKGMSLNDIKKLPIYIGNDDELNGIHTAWYVNIVDANNEYDADFIEMINEDHHNIKCNGKCIVIS